MKRALLLNPLLVLLVAAAGYGVCLAMGWNPHPRHLFLAALGCVVAAELAVVPLLLLHQRTAAAVSQASLLGTMVHLMVSLVIASGVVFGTQPPGAFLYWMLLFYWTTLLGVVVVFVRSVQSSSPPGKP